MSHNALHSRSRGVAVCLALVLAVGLNVLWGVAFAWTAGIVGMLFAPDDPFAYIQLAADGTPFIMRYHADGRLPDYTTLEGKKYPAKESTECLVGAEITVETPKLRWTITNPIAPQTEAFTDGQPLPVDWFFVQFPAPSRTGFFVGYDRVSRRKVGYLGQSGFQTDEPAEDQPFSINRRPLWSRSGLIAPAGVPTGVTPAQYYFQSFSKEPRRGTIPGAVLYFVSGDRLLRIDLRARTVETVLKSPGFDYIEKFSRAREADTKLDSGPVFDDALAVHSPGKVLVLDASGRPETSYQLPAELSDRSFRFYQLRDRTAVALDRRTDPKQGIDRQNLIWFTKDGTITRRIDGALTSRDRRLSLKSLALMVAFAVPAPIGPIGAAIAYPLSPIDYQGPARTYHEAVVEGIPATWPALVIAAIWTALTLWLYYRRTARFGEPRQAAWIVFLFIFGVAGYFGYVLHRRWPARIACPTCAAAAPRDRGACFDCGVEFPSPPANGLEIFA